MKKISVRDLTTIGILIAIIIVMAFTPLGYLRTFGLSVTLLHIPVIIGAILLGPRCGMILGTIFGLTSFAQAFGLEPFGTTLFSINPLGVFVMCMFPRVLLGLIAGILGKGLRQWKFGSAMVGAISSLCHTVLFMVTLCAFFYHCDYIKSFAEMLGTDNIPAFIAGFVGIQGGIEILLAGILTGFLVPILRKVRKDNVD